jgi:hypothetical protein
MANQESQETRGELMGTVPVLHDPLRARLCRTVLAQVHVAATAGTGPEELAPAKFFPRLAVASLGLTWAELACHAIQQANPTVGLQQPHWQDWACARTTLEAIRIEPRQGRRNKRRFCQGRIHWQSFPTSLMAFILPVSEDV